MEGGVLVLAALFAAGGLWPQAFGLFAIVTIPALVATHRVGLAEIPPTKHTSIPGEHGGSGWWTFGRLVQDRLGDFVLTILWNGIRSVTDHRV